MKKYKRKINEIKRYWNEYFYEINDCQRLIHFNENEKNYLADIFIYYEDTLDIIFSKSSPRKLISKFKYIVSLLQSIYVQQDLMKEMFCVFYPGYTLGNMIKDPCYSINREIRNEFIGHPIRRDLKNKKLVSSVFYCKQTSEKNIEYIRYKDDNNFDFQLLKYPIEEIKKRHKDFLDKYFNILENKLHLLLGEYLKRINTFKRIINTLSFDEIVNKAKQFYNPILEYDILYSEKNLKQLILKKSKHIRYENAIKIFYNDLSTHIDEKISDINEILLKKRKRTITITKQNLNISDIVFVSPNEKIAEETKLSMNYPFEKLYSRKTIELFEFAINLLKSELKLSPEIQNEIQHMRDNFDNEFEYYVSCHYLDHLIRG